MKARIIDLWAAFWRIGRLSMNVQRSLLVFAFCSSAVLWGAHGDSLPTTVDNSAVHRRALLARLHPTSLRDLLLFSSLYPDTAEGMSALGQAWKILTGHEWQTPPPLPPDFGVAATSLLQLIEPRAFQTAHPPSLPQETVALIETIGASLPHRSLKGHKAQTVRELLALPPDQVDLARALVLIDNAAPPAGLTDVEAALDILALELQARLGAEASEGAKIAALTHLLFHELNVRFPPQSEASEQTAQFSNLSSVLFSRRGVCLGASVLYLALAQRIGVPLSIFTPPGHIFVAHKEGDHIRAIETTARGIDIPLDQYLGLSLKSLPERTMKEVIGMVIFNRTSSLLQAKRWEEALTSYQQALQFDGGEEVRQMISLCHLLNGHVKQSTIAARELLQHLPTYRLEPDILLLDLAHGSLSEAAAATILRWSEAEGDELLEAIDELQHTRRSCPSSFVIPFHLAHAWLSYGKPKEALFLLEELCQRAEAPASVHALLAFLYVDRMNMTGAWREAICAVRLAQRNGHLPKPLYQLILALQQASPHCTDISDLLYVSSKKPGIYTDDH